MLDFIAMACAAGGLILLAALAADDIRTRRLPGAAVLGLAALGVAFHLATRQHYLPLGGAAAGAATGFAFLYAVRAAARRLCPDGRAAVGRGDMRLMAAGGLWLGPQGILLALAAGAGAALIHGAGLALRLYRRTGRMPDLARLPVPAGPGFAIGLVLAAITVFYKSAP